jgi:hypothetical protein
MPRAQCLLCHDHPAALPAALCRADVAQAQRDLRALPGWHQALLERPVNGLGRTRSSETPTPLSDRAGDVRHAIKATLVSWVHLTAEERTDPGTWPADNVPALAVWLAGHEAWLHAHPAAADYARELGDVVRQAQRAAAPGRSDLVTIGTCPGFHGEPCGGRVVCDPQTRDAWCLTCRERGDHTWWRRYLPVADEYMTMPRLVAHLAVAHLIQIRPGLIRLWAHRGEIRSVRQGSTATYRVDDVRNRASGQKRGQASGGTRGETGDVVAGQDRDPVLSETRSASLASPETGKLAAAGS